VIGSWRATSASPEKSRTIGLAGEAFVAAWLRHRILKTGGVDPALRRTTVTWPTTSWTPLVRFCNPART
jgi:hypothetical protein